MFYMYSHFILITILFGSHFMYKDNKVGDRWGPRMDSWYLSSGVKLKFSPKPNKKDTRFSFSIGMEQINQQWGICYNRNGKWDFLILTNKGNKVNSYKNPKNRSVRVRQSWFYFSCF